MASTKVSDVPPREWSPYTTDEKNNYDKVQLADMLKTTLNVFVNDPTSETWAQFPFCNFVTWVMHHEGVTRNVRISAKKTPHKHFELVTGNKLDPKIQTDLGRLDFNMSTPEGIFTMVAEMKPPAINTVAQRSTAHTTKGELLSKYK